MFNSDILKPNIFSSEEEDRIILYSGWEILAYTGIDNQESLKEKVKQYFDGDGWIFCEYDHRFFVQYGSFDSDVEIIFREIEYSDEHTKNTEKYKITFKSSYFGSRVTGENIHRKLCKMVLSRIPWKKRGFWIRNGSRFPIPRYRRLRLKRGKSIIK
jgi:hypothetical protein